MAAADPFEGGYHHHRSSILETQVASSDLSLLSRDPLPPLPLETHDHTDAFPLLPPDLSSPLPSPRSGRSKSLALTSSTSTGTSTSIGTSNSNIHGSASTTTTTSAPIKRKPLSSTASALAARYSTRDYLQVQQPLAKPETRFSRSYSVDSPTLYEFPRQLPSISSGTLLDLLDDHLSQPTSPVSVEAPAAQNLATTPAGGWEPPRNIPETDPADLQTTHARPRHDDLTASDSTQTATATTQDEEEAQHPDLVHAAAEKRNENNHNTNSTASTAVTTTLPSRTSMSLVARKAAPPHLTIQPVDNGLRAIATESDPNYRLEGGDIHKPLPKSPGPSKLTTFLGWTAPSPASTEFSDTRVSPLPSPLSNKPTPLYSDANASPASQGHTASSTARDETAHTSLDYGDYGENYLQTPSVGAYNTNEIDEMEDELKAISAELASSIRREMDLEELVERMQEQINNPQPGRRTSDYFSDSGYSSAKFSEYDQTREEIAHVQRRSEQEKAQLRLELTEKVQDERYRRKALDQQIQELSRKASQVDMAQMNTKDATGRIKELEAACDDLRRRLADERQVKDNFEDLLSALKGELKSASNERDNLRDEVVPQLRARVEGLEAAAVENSQMTYDATKLQQEVETLRAENYELRDSGPRASVSLSRSASVAGGPFRNGRPISLARSNTVKQTESREVLAERLKDVEAQRDALHNALKNLLDRQEHQNRENEKKVRVLEIERDRLLSASPQKAGYEKEISNLRDEIAVLRRRAEDAIEQKFQVETGLSGLKMDLDRAEEEIASLRQLLKEKDILIPASLARASGSSDELAVPVTSAALEKSYRELQAVYADALDRLKTMELGTTTDEKTKLAMQRLEQSLATAAAERDMALSEAESYRSRLNSLDASERDSLETERGLAGQLEESARRVEELAAQVRAQLESNAALRSRLTETVARGDAEQRASKQRIVGVQARLHTLEEQIVASQTSAEERIANHEEEMAKLKEAHNVQLQRLRPSSAGGPRSPRTFPPKSPMSPMFTVNGVAKSPRLSPLPSPRFDRPGARRPSTTPAESEGMTLQIISLRNRVTELEGALAAADAEMQEVVSRMNTAQIEVLNLQEERETAMRETRRLQRVIDSEKVRDFEARFKSITTQVRN